MFTDLSGADLIEYRSSQVDPPDFDAFWAATLAESRAFGLDTKVTRVGSPVTAFELYDVTFGGFQGQKVSAWLRVPAGASGPLATIVEFVGYGGGRGWAEDSLFWAASGFAHFQMDTRGQGAGWSVGVTPDTASAGPRVPGMMTAGIESRENYYYRRLITDAVRAVDAARGLEQVDADRVTVLGVSQGGGLALAVAGLGHGFDSVVSYVPFLCDFPRGITITNSDPYKEISRFLSLRHAQEDSVLEVLSYFDGVNFAKRATVPAWFTTTLMDDVCPPSTVLGAFNEYGGPKQLAIYGHMGHEHHIDEDVRTARALAEFRAGRGMSQAASRLSR